MSCTSGSVQTVANKTVIAKSQIDKLRDMLDEQESANKDSFFAQISAHLTDAKITDAREISYDSEIKTEYTSEFSLDAIAGVITAALKAAQAAGDPLVPEAGMDPASISAYIDVVNSVAEAAKSSATSSSSLSFSMNRLSPGMFAFLYAVSVTIKDVDTFGSEAVTSTAIYYRFMQSIDDIKNQAVFGEAIIDAKNLIKMKTLQAALTDTLASGEIDIDVWSKKDQAYSTAVSAIEKRLNDAHFDRKSLFVLGEDCGFGAAISHSFITGSTENKMLVKDAIKTLSSMDKKFAAAIDISQVRLVSNYF